MKHVAEQTGGVERLLAEGVLRREGDAFRTTRRWQAAMARAAVRFKDVPSDGFDLRVPIAWALVERFGAETPDAVLAGWTELLLPIEAAELSGRGRPADEPK